MRTPSRSRHWLRGIPTRMSLRTLMLLVLVVGGGLGWFALQRQREAHRKWVIATIQASGSSVDFDDLGISRISWFGGSANPAVLPQRPLTADEIDAMGSCDRLRELVMIAAVMNDDGLAALSHDRLLERLYGFKPKITDAGVKQLANLAGLKTLELLRVPELTDATLAHIAGLTNLEEITLSGTGIAGSGLIHLTGLGKLKSLTIPGSPLDDAAQANIGRLTSLQKLYIGGGGSYTDTGIASLSSLTALTELGMGSDGCTDACLANLARLTNLRILNIDGPQLTDAWLDRVAAMKSLREVQIWGAQVSDEAIARLHRSLPEVQIYVDGRPR
ncbi:MAG: leucine-rich repeat domain-containing protein [Isosphaerales bacterium]